MSSDIIYSILSSKSDKTNLIKRYLNFLEGCNRNNRKSKKIYYETHHICPKASDLFPEYSNLKHHKWNSSKLTFRQHLIAHVMLWKIFKGSQATALDCMLGKFNGETNELLYKRSVPSAFKLRYLEKLKIDAGERKSAIHKGRGTFKDVNGKKYYLDVDDPLISSLGLVGNNRGYKHSEETRQLISKSKYPNKRVKLYFLNHKTSVKLLSSRYVELIEQGWSLFRSKDDIQYIRSLTGDKIGSKLKGRANYMDSNGNHVGRFSHDDPRILNEDLKPLRTEAQELQNKRRSALAVEALTGASIYNNGKEEARFRDDPGGEWKLGRLPRSDEHRQKILDSLRKKQVGSKYFNNGKICQKFMPGTQPLDWIPGMLPR